MIDFVIYAPDWDTLNAYAETLGPNFWNADTKTINTSGPLPGGGSYFANISPPDVPTGAWVRLRLNGENLFALGQLPMPAAPIVVYPPTETPGTPDGYVQPPYGQIA